MRVTKATACVVASVMALFGASSSVMAAGCPFAGLFIDMAPGDVVADSIDFENKSVDFVGFVGDPSLDLVGVAIQDVDGGAVFGIDGQADCTARPPVSINREGDSRFDDAVIRCGFLSVPDSLSFAIGLLNIDFDEIPEECTTG